MAAILTGDFTNSQGVLGSVSPPIEEHVVPAFREVEAANSMGFQSKLQDSVEASSGENDSLPFVLKALEAMNQAFYVTLWIWSSRLEVTGGSS